jgi:hypothetical protein
MNTRVDLGSKMKHPSRLPDEQQLCPKAILVAIETELYSNLANTLKNRKFCDAQKCGCDARGHKMEAK